MKYGCFCRVKCAANFTHLHTNTCLSMHKSAIMHRRSSAIAIVVVDIINKPTNAISSNSDRQPENVYVHNCYTKKSTVSFAKCNVNMLLLLLLLLCLLQHLLPVAVTVAVTAAVTIGHWLNTHFSFRCGKRVNSFLPNERRKCATRDAARRRHSNEINKKKQTVTTNEKNENLPIKPPPLQTTTTTEQQYEEIAVAK